MIDVIGHVADNKNPTLSHLQIIHSMPVHFIGRSDPITKHREPRFNPGKDDASLIFTKFFLSMRQKCVPFLAVLENSVLRIGWDSSHATLKVTSEF